MLPCISRHRSAASGRNALRARTGNSSTPHESGRATGDLPLSGITATPHNPFSLLKHAKTRSLHDCVDLIVVRWPGTIQPRTQSGVSHAGFDLFPAMTNLIDIINKTPASRYRTVLEIGPPRAFHATIAGDSTDVQTQVGTNSTLQPDCHRKVSRA